MKNLLDSNVPRSSSGRNRLLNEETREPRRVADLPPPEPVTPDNRSPMPPTADPARVQRPRRHAQARPVNR